MQRPTKQRGGCAASHAHRARAGFGLIEVMLSLSVMMIALLAFSQAILASLNASQIQREQGIARDAARQMIERMQSEVFAEVFARYNGDQADDPPAGNIFPGGFAVEGLQVQQGDPDGLVGEILFPTAAAGGPGVLREDVQDARLGTPRDLNADGVVDALDHSGDYRLLPVVVRLSWRGRAGDSFLEFRTWLADL